jgi:hypothetical protein
MSTKRMRLIAGVLTAVCTVMATFVMAPAGAAAVCTWAGTPTAPSGTFTIKPGLTSTPAAQPLKFYAMGPLAGGGVCSGTMVFDGYIGAGSTCALAAFDGKVKGLSGVREFHGAGNLLAPSLLYNKAGSVVGSEHPQLATGVGSGSELSDCNTPQGFTDGSFSSVVQLF